MYEEKKNEKCDILLQACENEPQKPNVSIGKIYTKVPVILAELTLHLNLDACIEFPMPVLEIKDVKKYVKIVQCRLLLPTNKLFVKGFVRKNIQYASPETTPECEGKSISSKLHSWTVDVPFSCVTEIKHYLKLPVMPMMNERTEFDFLFSEALPNAQDDIQSKHLSQFHQNSTQYYNELPYCELVSSHIIEWDEAINRTLLQQHSIGEGVFTKLEEKMVVNITLKVLQLQQIRVTSTTNDDCEDYC